MSRHPFDLLMELRTDLIRLDCAALHLARDEYFTLNLRRYLGRLDTLANEVAALRPGLSATLRYQALRRVLVENHGLTGNHADYYNPDNSFLNRVLDTGRGIPISLSIIWIEVARRLKWPAGGVAFPGHFLVRIDDPERLVLADPFHGGRSLSVDDCRNMLEEHFQQRSDFDLTLFKPVGTRRMLLRLLKNLRNIYLADDDLPRLANTLRHMAAVDPKNGQHLQELAAVCCRRGDVRGACAHLELYLHRVPNGRDTGIVRRNLRQLHAALIALN
jgi:regulator of sirC expression with transglutaminase-like and TPR domain